MYAWNCTSKAAGVGLAVGFSWVCRRLGRWQRGSSKVRLAALTLDQRACSCFRKVSDSVWLDLEKNFPHDAMSFPLCLTYLWLFGGSKNSQMRLVLVSGAGSCPTRCHGGGHWGILSTGIPGSPGVSCHRRQRREGIEIWPLLLSVLG